MKKKLKCLDPNHKCRKNVNKKVVLVIGDYFERHRLT